MSKFAKPAPAEAFLDVLSQAALAGELACEQHTPSQPSLPMVLIVGAPRSGTTLLTQWLADSRAFAVPSNLLARLYQAPYLGALIQRLLTDPELGYLDELATGGEVSGQYQSVVGKTAGILAPHEFSYFWRRFFPVGPCEPLTAQQWQASDHAGFRKALAALEVGLAKPLAMKGLILQYNIKDLAQLLPNAIFVHTVRDEVATVDSLLNARRTVSSEDQWFAVRPPGSELVTELDPLTQVAAQVAWTNDSIREELSELDPSRFVEVGHEDFCADQRRLWSELASRCEALGWELQPAPTPQTFAVSHRIPADVDRYRQALDQVRAMRPPTGSDGRR